MNSLKRSRMYRIQLEKQNHENILIERELYRNLVAEMGIFVHDASSWLTSINISADMLQMASRDNSPRVIDRMHQTVDWAESHLSAFMPLLSQIDAQRTAAINLEQFFAKYHLFLHFIANNRRFSQPRSDNALRFETNYFVPDLVGNEAKLLLVSATILQIMYGQEQGVWRVQSCITQVSEAQIEQRENYTGLQLRPGEYARIRFSGSDILLNNAIARWTSAYDFVPDRRQESLQGVIEASNLILTQWCAGLWFTKLSTGLTAATLLFPINS